MSAVRIRARRRLPTLGDRRNRALLLLPAAGFVAGLLVVLFRHALLPAKFFFDSEHIQAIAIAGRDPFSDHSFENAAYIYRILGLEHAELAAGLLSFALATYVVWTALRLVELRMTWAGAVLAAVALVLSGVYLGTYSKDVFVLPVVLLILKAAPSPRGTAWVLVGLALYADLFRSYWYIVLVLFVVFALAARVVPRRLVLVLGPPLALVLIGLGTWLVLHEGADFARLQVNAGRNGSVDAQTLIPEYLHIAQPWSGILNSLIVLLTILVPVPLLLKGSPYYVAATVLFVAVWGLFLWSAWSSRRPSATATRAALIVVAVLTTQSLFEPDYGSVLRHLTPLLALLAFVALDRGRAATAPGPVPRGRLQRAVPR